MAGEEIKTPFGTTKSENRYLLNRLDVQGARAKLSDANLKLTLARRFFESVSTTSKNYQKYADEVKAAQATYDEAKVELERVEAFAKADYKKSFAKIEKKKSKAEGAKIDKQIESATTQLQRLKDSGQSTVQQEAVIQDLVDKKNKTGKYTPKVEDEVVGDQGASNKPTTDYTGLINNAPRYIKDLTPQARKELSQLLKDSDFYEGPVVDIYTDDLVQAYQTALASNQARSIALGEDISWGQFLMDKAREAKALAKSKTQTRVSTDVAITSKTAGQVDADINDIAVKVLGRDISEEDKAEDWYGNLVNSINKMYEKGTKTVTTSTTRKSDGGIISGSKRVTTPSVAEADIDALIERRLRKNDPESVGRKERLDFVSWLNKSLGD